MTDETPREPIAREGEHVPPVFGREAFHCASCGVLASQWWNRLQFPATRTIAESDVWAVRCRNCNAASYWLDEEPAAICLHPVVGGGPRPHPSMPDDVRADYDEARAIVARSPRGRCALLRLAAQKLADDLEPKKGDLGDKIGWLVASGLPVKVQQALDALRVIGNEAVHPGALDLRDDVETAGGLFELLNVVVEDRIEQPKRIAAMYAKLPATKLQGIEQRDS